MKSASNNRERKRKFQKENPRSNWVNFCIKIKNLYMLSFIRLEHMSLHDKILTNLQGKIQH